MGVTESSRPILAGSSYNSQNRLTEPVSSTDLGVRQKREAVAASRFLNIYFQRLDRRGSHPISERVSGAIAPLTAKLTYSAP